MWPDARAALSAWRAREMEIQMQIEERERDRDRKIDAASLARRAHRHIQPCRVESNTTVSPARHKKTTIMVRAAPDCS